MYDSWDGETPILASSSVADILKISLYGPWSGIFLMPTLLFMKKDPHKDYKPVNLGSLWQYNVFKRKIRFNYDNQILGYGSSCLWFSAYFFDGDFSNGQ